MLNDAGTEGNILNLEIDDNQDKVGDTQEAGIERNNYEYKLKDMDFITEFKLADVELMANKK